MNQARWNKRGAPSSLKHRKHAESFNRNYAVRERDLLPLPDQPQALATNRKAKTGITAPARLRMCFPSGPLDSMGSLARQFKVAKSTMTYSAKGMAECVCSVQDVVVGHALAVCQDAQEPITVAIDRMKWDETRQRVSVRSSLDGGPLALQAGDNQSKPALTDPRPFSLLQPRANGRGKGRGAKHGLMRCKAKGCGKGKARRTCSVRRLQGGSEEIMVQRRWMRFSKIVSKDTDVEMKTLDLLVPLLCPPLMLKANNAETIAAGLERCAPIPLARFEEINAKRKVRICECDAAKQNISVVNRMRRNKPGSLILFLMFCWIHQLSLVTLIAIASLHTTKAELVNSLFSMSLVLRTPGCFQLLLNAMETCVLKFLVILDDVDIDPKAGEVSRRILITCGWDVESPDVIELLFWINHWWFLQWGLVHVCKCTKPCQKEILAPWLAQLFLRLFCAGRPDVPIPARWTLVFQSLGWYTPFTAMHGFFSKLFLFAFGVDDFTADDDDADDADVPPEVAAAAPPEPAVHPDQAVADVPEEDELPDMEKSRQEYQKEYGKRKGKGVRLCRDPSTSFSQMLLTMVIGPLHYALTHTLKVAGLRSACPESPDCPIPVLDLMNPQVSTLTVVLQYYAELLMKPALGSSLMILAGYFVDGEIPRNLWTTICRMICGTMGSLFFRGVSRLLKAPW
jgi:hypothetical protein